MSGDIEPRAGSAVVRVAERDVLERLPTHDGVLDAVSYTHLTLPTSDLV